LPWDEWSSHRHYAASDIMPRGRKELRYFLDGPLIQRLRARHSLGGLSV
jgi:hypothetical protein